MMWINVVALMVPPISKYKIRCHSRLLFSTERKNEMEWNVMEWNGPFHSIPPGLKNEHTLNVGLSLYSLSAVRTFTTHLSTTPQQQQRISFVISILFFFTSFHSPSYFLLPNTKDQRFASLFLSQ
jgi:hypothetical protein